MSTIVTRAGKSAPLTHTEMDANFTNLNTDKIESILAEPLDTNDNAIKNTSGVNGRIDITTRTHITQNIANNLLQLENQNTQGLGLSIKAGDQAYAGSLAILSVADKDSNLKFIVKASGEVNVYDSLGVDSLYIDNADATTAQITTLTSGHDLNITTNGGTLSLNSINWPASDGSANQLLQTNGSGQLSFVDANTLGLLENVSEDTTPQLGGFLDQNGQYIGDSTRNYQVQGNQASPSGDDYDSFNNTNRVHGVVNVTEIDTPTNRVHSHPRLTKITAGADSSNTSNGNAGRIRGAYVETVYDLNSYDNTTQGFGRGQNGMFISSMTKNNDSANGASALSQQTGITVTNQFKSDSTGGLTVTDARCINMEPNINSNGSGGSCVVTNQYGLFYNSVNDGPGVSAYTNEYSFYGNVQQASMYNKGGFELPSYTVSELASWTNKRTGTMAYCSDEAGGAVPVFWDGSNWRRMTDRNIVS